MAQYLGIEQSTDIKCQMTKLRLFTSRKRTLAWIAESACRLTYADPEGARNFHHTLRDAVELPKGRGLTTLRREVIKKDKATPYNQRGVYYGSTDDRVASLARRVGTKVSEETSEVSS